MTAEVAPTAHPDSRGLTESVFDTVNGVSASFPRSLLTQGVLRIAPLTNESILNYIGERMLGLPRS